ncbi:MAG TPA: hypothetical protein VIK66_09480 [Gaiellaceae bacterium]|jgi:hypothetical protein
MRFAQVETMRDAGVYVSDIGQALQYRPDLFGGPFSVLCQQLMRGPSEWTAGERELFAAFVSSQRQCPF